MSSPMLKGLGRRFALIGALMALMLGATASSAFAELNLSESGPFNAVDEIEEVTAVAAGEFASATHVAFAECNVQGATTQEDLGKLCALANAKAPAALTEEGERTESSYPVMKGFLNWNFSSGVPMPVGTATTCLGAAPNQQCAVVASWYELEDPEDPESSLVWIGAEAENISFK